MSYDLSVFDPDAAPKEREQFIEWYNAQTSWEEDNDYDDPATSTSNLRAWFLEMIKDYPAMNGPYAVDEDVFDSDAESYISDYSVGKKLISIAFAYSVANEAHESVFRLASKYGLGFVDCDSIWFPNSSNNLELRFKWGDNPQ